MTSQTGPLPLREPFFWFKWMMILLAFIVVGALCAASVSALIGQLTKVQIGVMNFEGLSKAKTNEVAWVYRLIVFSQHLFAFILPALLAMRLYKQQEGDVFFNFSPKFNLNAALIGVFILMCSYPLVQFSSEVNKMIPLPDVLRNMEDQTAKLVSLMLNNDSILVLLVNVFLIALIPAIGEELIFRGFLQTIIKKLIFHKHVTVWLTAIIFSAIHIQFEGFFPRMILGLVLGYLMMWSGNIIYPMIAHFTNNAVQVILQYTVRNDATRLEKMDNYNVPIWLVIGSVVVLALSTHLFQKYFIKNKALS
ncbi:MAG: CPBP family intramembrane metalloprotease [Saprospiraceae bacterium]|nr:CPBP family intramembrane metalloprotease [Candidatus Brachybacter algidus]MBK8746550.1 CPBP family intramembrane metalloprotease [Candidatus Brachybacter algidus]